MKSRRSLVFALLACLLVACQQMGLVHGLTHWPGAERAHQAQGQDGHERRQLPTPLPDKNCAQCLAFAQVGSALATPCHFFPLAPAAARATVPAATVPFLAAAAPVFEARAPPPAV